MIAMYGDMTGRLAERIIPAGPHCFLLWCCYTCTNVWGWDDPILTLV